MRKSKTPPTLPIELAIPSACLTDLKAETDLLTLVTAAIVDACADVLADLGIPGKPAVTIQALEAFRTPYLARVRVNGHTMRCPAELLARVQSAVFGTPLNTAAPLHLLAAWLDAAAAGQSAAFLTEHRRPIIDFLSLLCREMVTRKPSVLLDAPQVKAYRATLPQPVAEIAVSAWPPTITQLYTMLRHVLDLGVSISDRQTVANVIGQGIAAGRAPDDVAEDLIAALRPDVVEILIRRDDLRALTLANTNEDRDTFTLVRDGLFYDLGLTFPDFRFVPTDWLKPGSFAVRINHVTTLPFVGLEPDQRLVNARSDTLQSRNIPALPCVNPVNWGATSITSAGDLNNAADLWVWDPIEVIALVLSGVLREHSACFVDTQIVAQQLSTLEPITPALTKAISARITEEQLAQIERSLVAEGISVRDLTHILESLLDFDFIVADSYTRLVFDERIAFPEMPSAATLTAPENLTRFVRMGSKRYISHRATSEQYAASLSVYLLDQELATSLTEVLRQGEVPITVREHILDALEEEFHLEPLPSPPPALLVGQNLRALLHAITATEFPRLRVWAFEELTPEIQILPVGTIAL